MASVLVMLNVRALTRCLQAPLTPIGRKLTNMTTLQDRIARLMSETGMSVGEIARIAGVTSSAVTQWKDGPTKSLKTAPATKLAAAS